MKRVDADKLHEVLAAALGADWEGLDAAFPKVPDDTLPVVRKVLGEPEVGERPGFGKAEVCNSPTWPFVMRMARYMEQKLSENRHKGDAEGWRRDDPGDLLQRVREEADELGDEICRHKPNPEAVWREAADIANMAMMVADAVEHAEAKVDDTLPVVRKVLGEPEVGERPGFGKAIEPAKKGGRKC